MGRRTHQITLIPGDWIGPETCDVAVAVLAAAGVDINWRRCERDMPMEELIAACRATGVVLKARIGASGAAGTLPPTVVLRKELGAWATVRRVRPFPGVPARFPDTDLVVVRETSEDIYSGLEHEVADGVYEAVKVTTRAACERIARFAYDYATRHQRSKVTIVHKSNIMKQSDGLFLSTAREIGRGYENRGVTTEEVIVDALCMRLVRRPTDFDVLLTGNLFGDIVGDLCSGLAGGLMACPSFSLGDEIAVFENPHGRAPDLVGTGRANPMPMLLAACDMLEYLGEHAAASRIRDGLAELLARGVRTADLGGDARCADIQDGLIAHLGAPGPSAPHPSS